jgi:hypothetical protein
MRYEMNITTDLTYIRTMAKKRENENWQFRSFLKRLDMSSRDIDAIVHRINERSPQKSIVRNVLTAAKKFICLWMSKISLILLKD